ncbi:MAG: bacteriohemerythrin [Deltaproteobacteria bacterium]|nr:bacteriohemerythrin [Deltaproteobacteria bacterium]
MSHWEDQFGDKALSIDTQRRKILALTNELSKYVKQGKAALILDKIFANLYDYIETHFKYEEDLFRRFHYHDSKNHIDEHEFFIRQVNRLHKDHLEKDDPMIGCETFNFLLNWLTLHVKGLGTRASLKIQ